MNPLTSLHLTGLDPTASGYKVKLEGYLTPEQYQALIALLPTDHTDLSESSPNPSASLSASLLTLRELDILRLVTLNRASNASISTTLGITVHTVASHMTHIMTKLNVRSRKQAAEYAREAGLFPPTPIYPLDS